MTVWRTKRPDAPAVAIMLRCRMGKTNENSGLEVHVRRVEQPDLPDLQRMVSALTAHHGDTTRLNLETLSRDVLGDAHWLTALVAEVGGSILGYATFFPHARPFGPRCMYLHHLYVDPEMRGSGIGRRLIEATDSIARALDCDFMVVGTEPNNLAAQAVYAACGFEALPGDSSHFWKKVVPRQNADVQNS